MKESEGVCRPRRGRAPTIIYIYIYIYIYNGSTILSIKQKNVMKKSTQELSKSFSGRKKQKASIWLQTIQKAFYSENFLWKFNLVK